MEHKMRIYDLIEGPSALTVEQGDLVYKEIKKALDKSEKVVLDFDGIESMITPFLNSAIGKLYGDFNSEELSKKISIVNQPEGSNRKINMVIQNAKVFYLNKEEYSKIVNSVLGD